MSPAPAAFPEIIAHRGASHDAPENTAAAARLGWAQGADALECDVHLTRDGRLAVVHDDDLQRVAGHRIRVADTPFEELRRFDVGAWKGRAFSGERIPELSELLATVPSGRRAFVELKGGPELVPALARTLVATRFDRRRLVVISFALPAVVAAKRAWPEAEAAWVAEQSTPRQTVQDILRAARAAGVDALDLQHDWPVDAAAVRRVHEAGLKLYVWTVDDPVAALRLVDAGVDGITTNRPGWLREQIRAARGL